MPFQLCNNSILVFQHTAARRRLHNSFASYSRLVGFNTQPPEGGCWVVSQCSVKDFAFQHTAARRRLQPLDWLTKGSDVVSTHSRPKAAANSSKNHSPSHAGFQHTAARRRLLQAFNDQRLITEVSTHSRPKAAAARQNVGW